MITHPSTIMLLPPLPTILIAALLAVAFATADPRPACSDSQTDCGYFGCFPPGSICPADCDTFNGTDTCTAVMTADNRQACMFNPQYSKGKGICQKNVTCYNLPGGKCSPECFYCGYFGCLPSATKCPASCDKFDSASECETLGGVAGGMACQWDTSVAKCGQVPLAKLTRTLDPTPIRAFPALTIDENGATITPPGFPVAQPPTPTEDAAPFLDWAGAQNSPRRVALYVGFSIAVFGLISFLALMVYRRATKAQRNKALAEGLPVRNSGDLEADGMAGAPALFHRESLIVHVREAIEGEQNQPQQPPLAALVSESGDSSTAASEAATFPADAPSHPESPSPDDSATIFARRLSAINSIEPGEYRL